MSLTLDLFADPEPAPVIGVDLATGKDYGTVTAHIPGFEKMAPKTQEALCTMVQAAYDAASRGQLPGPRGADAFAMARLEDQWPHAFAFVAQARKSGSTDPSLTPVQVSAAGRREFNLDELARYANELLRGVRSTRPTMTPERWGEAIAKVREIGGKS